MNVTEFYTYLNSMGIPSDDSYPPLHGLKCFKQMNLRKGIDYSNANWGESKSNNNNFPVTSLVSSQLVELPQEVLLADKPLMDYIVKVIRELRESFSS